MVINSSMPRIGFMQGRLSPLVDGKIQAFPSDCWRAEFVLAERHSFPLIEWTLDHEGLSENPLMTRQGRAEIKALQQRHGIAIVSLTGDCFMQAPFFKAKGPRAIALRDELHAVLNASAELGIRFVLIPLVDNGRIEGPEDVDRLRAGLDDLKGLLNDADMKILFESDFSPDALRHFIATLPTENFGLTYDIGNSASLGFDPNEEFAAYGDRIDNVHIKDRDSWWHHGSLGQGAADLPLVFRLLGKSDYRGDFILQTARASNGEHAAALCRYRDLVRGWLAGIS